MEGSRNIGRAYDARSYTSIAINTTKTKYIKLYGISERKKLNADI